MPKTKLKLEYITNDSARRSTFNKRKKGLMKKVSEISTLCGVNACAIIYGPYDTQPAVWPSHLGAHRVLADFMQMPDMDQNKNMVNQDSFLRQMITKSTLKLTKQQRDNRENELTQVMFQSLVGRGLEHLNMMDLNDLGRLTDQRLMEVLKQRELLMRNMASPQVAVQAAGAPPPPEVTAAVHQPPLAWTTVAPTPPAWATPQLPAAVTVPAAVASATTPDAIVSSTVDQTLHADQRPCLEMNMESMQWQTWLMEMMNPQEHTGFGGVDVIPPYEDTNSNALWSNGFLP